MPNTDRSGAGRPGSFSIPLSVPRRIVCDLVHFAHKIPTVPVKRVVDVSRIAPLREALPARVGWCTLFTKAYALVARDMPELRRAYLAHPWARLYQHAESIASVAVERQFGDEGGVFFAHLRRPEATPLHELEAALRWHKEAPVPTAFGFALRFYRVPRPVRRLLWWYLLNVRGSRKAQFLGTFGVTVYSSLGAESLHPLSPLTTTLSYGVIRPDGRVKVRVVYDHRALDGGTVARALGRLEEVLNGEIHRELVALTSSRPEALGVA
ncbi:2-oxo acid dehydrogenase subunit E2 [Gemmata sp. JC717]|uniref:2-oxo acid dehydrogenase subunit E2 n=1 Tax=Gemmata algarum TaxID=2975278 RepID=UPI0021BB6DFA|nr:2-oxo acid dehydrogenase subunit E2 [Gemmata algarum]MDY3555014.1 2-oxo acid dehydrogenase subunit E2 [Gemmata algarum]